MRQLSIRRNPFRGIEDKSTPFSVHLDILILTHRMVLQLPKNLHTQGFLLSDMYNLEAFVKHYYVTEIFL